jgi:hypothetical protein
VARPAANRGGGMLGLPPAGVAACCVARVPAWGWRHATSPPHSAPFHSPKTEHKYGTVPFLKFFRTEHRVGTIPCPRNGTIPFRPTRFQNRTHPKIMDVHWIYVYHPWNYQNKIRNIILETKKTNPRWILSQKDKNANPHYSHSNFSSFLFLHVYFKFGSGNLRECKYTSCEHLQICFNFFWYMEFECSHVVSW